MPWNECIRCVRASGHVLDHFWWMGDLTLRFWAKMAKTRGRNTQKRALSGRCAWGRALGARFQKVSSWGRALGAHSQSASARRCTSSVRHLGQDNGNVVPCPGAWGQSCRGPMWSFCSVLLLFSLTFLLEHNWLCWNLDFPNGLKFVSVSFRFFGFCWKMNFCELKGLQAWSYRLRQDM